MAIFPLNGHHLTPFLLNISCALQSRKDGPQATAATSVWTQRRSRLLYRRAMSMTPLLPPCPSLTDSRSTPARCISTGDLRRYTVKEVRFKTQFKIKIHTRCFNCELGRDQSDVVGFRILVTWACSCGWYSGLHIIVRIECAWHYKGDCPGLRQECGVTLSASFISLAQVRYGEVHSQVHRSAVCASHF